jgi:hypothetical protein
MRFIEFARFGAMGRAARTAGCVAICTTFVSRTASADLRMKWDCYLPGASVDCLVIENSLTSKIPFLTVVGDTRHASVVVSLTSVATEGGTRFEFRFIGKRVNGFATEVRTSDKIPDSVDATTAMVRIMTKLERGLAQFMEQKTEATVEAGRLTIRVADPAQAPPYTGRPEQESLRWYVVPSAGTYFSDVEGVGINAAGNASVSFNYSGPGWRVQQSIGANYSRQSQPVPGTSETASIHFAGGNATNALSWSFTQDTRWSLGLLLSAEKNPQANYHFRANGSVGVEFDLVPLQTVNQRNFGFRCAIGPEFEHYDVTNIQGIDEQMVGREFCDLFLSWHFAPVDVSGSLGESAMIEDVDYRSFSASLSATWRITDNFTVSPWVGLQQIHKAINEAQPTNVVYSDPREEIEASMLAAVQQGYTAPFGIQSSLTLRYLFGNGSLSSEDQHWKNASNLR